MNKPFYLAPLFFILFFATCKKIEGDQNFNGDPEEKYTIVYYDGIPTFKFVLKRWSVGNIGNNVGNEGLKLTLHSLREISDSLLLNIKVSVNEDTIYNITRNFLVNDSLDIDSIIGKNWLGDISQYNTEIKILPKKISENDLGTYNGFVLVQVDSPNRYKPFRAILDTFGDINVSITNDYFTNVNAIIFRDSLLLGKLYTATDSYDIDFSKSRIKIKDKILNAKLHFAYDTGGVISTGTLIFDGNK